MKQTKKDLSLYTKNVIMLMSNIKYFIITIVSIWFSSYASSQESTIFHQNEQQTSLSTPIDFFLKMNSSNNTLLSELDELETRLGIQDTIYLKKIIEAGIIYGDTVYHKYWPSLAPKMLRVQDIIPATYGIDSEEYRLYMVGLYYLSFGMYIEKGDYIDEIWNAIHSLEKIYSKTNHNRIEFASLLANYYQHKLDNGDKTIYWRKEKFKLAKQKKDIDPQGYQYAVIFLIQADCQYRNGKKLESLIDDLDISDIPLFAQKECWSSVLISLSPNTSDETILVLIDKYHKSLGQLKNIIPLIDKLCIEGRNNLIEQIEDALEIKKCTPMYQYDYYLSKALTYGLGQHYTLAIPSLEKCVELAKSIGNRSLLYLDNIHLYINIACLYHSIDNNWDNYQKYYIKALNDIEMDYGKESKEYLEACLQISTSYTNLSSNYQKSLEYKEMALPAIKKHYGIDSDYYGRVLTTVISDKRSLGKVEEAIEIGLERLSNDKCKDTQATRGSIHNQMAMCYAKIHDNIRAEQSYLNAINCEEHPTYYNNLASLYRKLKRYDDALDVLQKEEKYLIRTKCKDARALFNYNSGMAHYFSDINPTDAIPYYQKAESYIDPSIGLDHQISFYQTWANCYSHINNKYKQRECLDKCLSFYNDYNCNDSILYGVILRDYAAYYDDISDYSKAEDFYNKAMELYQRIGLNNDDDRYTTLINNYAIFCGSHGNIDKEIYLEKKLCDIRKKSLGKHDDHYILSLNNLLQTELKNKNLSAVDSIYNEYLVATNGNGNYNKQKVFLKALISEAKGDLSNSEQLFQESLNLSQEDDYKLRILDELCNVYKQQHSSKIYDVLAQYVDLDKKWLIHKFMYMSNEERKNIQSYYVRNLLIENIKNDHRVIDLASNYCLFHKSISLQTQTAIEKRLVHNKNTNILYTQLKEKRATLAKAIAAGNQALAEKCQDEIGHMERELTYLFIDANKIYGDVNIETSDILNKIGSNLGLNFVRYGHDKDSLRYGVFLISQHLKRPLFVDLCSEQEIADASDAEVKSNHDRLYSLIWQPIEQYIQESSNVFFSPDGILHKIAIETFTGNGSCNSADFHRVLSLMDITSKDKSIIKHILAMGDIDYNEMDAYISESSRGNRGKLKKWNSLKGTALELAAIYEALNGLKDMKIDMYVQDRASEGQFKSYDNSSVNCIHLATHGFYYDNLKQNESAFNQRLFSCKKSSSAGLILSGANKAWTSSDITLGNNTEDGILTPDEVENLSFPNLNLVILSACETGLGNIDVDGVWGMQRSFRITGAKNIIVSLSKINDAITANFMSDFYNNIASHRSIHDSFYMAQNKLKSKYSNTPAIYSAFILVE